MKLLQITQELEGYYVLELRFYCLFKLQYFTQKLILIRTTPPDCVAEGHACGVCAPKALNQWGGEASPLIQRFRDVRRGVSINTSANLQDDVDVDLSYVFGHYACKDIHFVLHLTSLSF